MVQWDYLKFFLTGKKSSEMLDIENRYPNLDEGFKRRDAIFHAIGNIGIDFKWGWIIILPARHSFEYIKDAECLHLSIGILSLWYRREQQRLTEVVEQ